VLGAVGDRNFEGRIHAETEMNFLTSPPLVIAYALAGSMHVDLPNDPLGVDGDGQLVFLRDIWPTTQEIKEVVDECLKADMFTAGYANVFDGDENWRGLDVPSANMFAWTPRRPTCASRRTSRACPASRSRCVTSPVPGCSPCSATP